MIRKKSLCLLKATREDQLENASNFEVKGQLFLVRCMSCAEDARGRENWAISVAKGECGHCGWTEKD